MVTLAEQDGSVVPGTSSPSVLRKDLPWIGAAFVLLVVFCLGNLDLLTGRASAHWDGVDYFGPEFSLIADHAKAGRLVLWDPWFASGTPDSAEPEFGTTSPVVLAAALLSPGPRYGFLMYWLFIWILGPFGILLLCRYLGAPAWAGLIAALGFATCGFYTGHAEHTAHVYSVSFIPWILWRFDVALTRRSYWAAVQSGILYGVSALGGYPVHTVATACFVFLWAVGLVFFGEERPNESKSLRRRLAFSAVAMLLLTAIGAAVMSPAYVAFFKDTRGYSDRNGPRSREEVLHSNILPAGDVSTLASPYLGLLNVKSGRLWPDTDVSMRSIYAGCVVAALALFSLTGGSRWRWWLFFLAVLFLCCAMGYQLPLRGWLYDYVPPMRYFRNAASYRTYAILVCVILAALGGKDISRATAANTNHVLRRFFLCSVVLGIASIVMFAMVAHLATTLPLGLGFSKVHLAVTWGAIIVASYFLWRGPARHTAIFGLLIAVAAFDAIATLRISQFTLDSTYTMYLWKIMDAQENKNLNLSGHGWFRQYQPPDILNSNTPARYPNNRNLPLKIPVFHSDIVIRNRFYTQMVKDPILPQMALGNNRIWFVPQAVWASPTDANFAEYVQRVHQLQKPVVVLHSAAEMAGVSKNPAEQTAPLPAEINAGELQAANPAEVSQLSYWPNQLSFHYLASQAGWLVVTDRWAPGWKVTVSGRPQEVLGADFVYRAVRVEPGDNFIVFRYRPWGWPYLLILSWGTLLIAGLGQVAISIRSFRRWRNHNKRTARNE